MMRELSLAAAGACNQAAETELRAGEQTMCELSLAAARDAIKHLEQQRLS